eukprot:gene5770-4121_t
MCIALSVCLYMDITLLKGAPVSHKHNAKRFPVVIAGRVFYDRDTETPFSLNFKGCVTCVVMRTCIHTNFTVGSFGVLCGVSLCCDLLEQRTRPGICGNRSRSSFVTGRNPPRKRTALFIAYFFLFVLLHRQNDF